ncbi:MAG TPA: cupredoxin domain-containing protein [Fimbriimonadales bacterium]|nr:cupredoxin domain-containing protein [Fimbriimonadales bacterium]
MKTILMSIALALTIGTAPFAQQQECDCCKKPTDEQAKNSLQISPDKKGVQKATIKVDNGFSPATIIVKTGKLVELTFDTKSRGCATEVVFKTLKIRKGLTDGKKTVVTFTPKNAGTYVFECPMGMYKGKIVAK